MMNPSDLVDEAFAAEALLPLDLIRQHTKTDDIPAVTDALLSLYRQAALEAAEAYTGLLLSGKKAITEAVRPPLGVLGVQRRYFTHRTSYAFASPLAWYYGFDSAAPVKVDAVVASNEVRLPILALDFGMGCCNPCGGQKAGAKLLYSAGFSCAAAVPAAFRIGALKYIAHLIENPGDNVIAASGAGGSSDKLSSQVAANPAVASGAIEIWRSLKADAI